MINCDKCGQQVTEETMEQMDSLGEVRWTPSVNIEVTRVSNGWLLTTTRHIMISNPDDFEGVPVEKYYTDEVKIYHTLGDLTRDLPSMVNYLRNTEEAFNRELGWDAVTNNPDR